MRKAEGSRRTAKGRKPASYPNRVMSSWSDAQFAEIVDHAERAGMTFAKALRDLVGRGLVAAGVEQVVEAMQAERLTRRRRGMKDHTIERFRAAEGEAADYRALGAAMAEASGVNKRGFTF